MHLRELAELIGRLRTAEPPYRADAVRRLKRLRAERRDQLQLPLVRAAIESALDDPDVRVRREGVELVAREWSIGRTATAAAPFDDTTMIRLLADPDARVVLCTAAAMAAHGRPEPVPALLALLRNPDAETRSRAVRSIDLLGQRMPRQRSAETVDRVLGPLIDTSDDSDAAVRCAAVHALGTYGDPRAVAALVAAARRPRLRSAVFGSLGMIGGSEAMSLLITGLADPCSYAAESAATALGWTGDPAAVEPLIRVGLVHPSSNTRFAAIRALGTLHAHDAVPALIDRLDDPNPNVIAQAARVLGLLGDPRARSALQAHLSDERALSYYYSDSIPMSRPGQPRVLDYAAYALARL